MGSAINIEDVVLDRVCILGIFCPKQGQGFKPSAAQVYPNIGRVHPPPQASQPSNGEKFSSTTRYNRVQTFQLSQDTTGRLQDSHIVSEASNSPLEELASKVAEFSKEFCVWFPM